MAMTKTYDVVAIIGKYTNKQGEEKKQYLTIGSVLENEKGLSLKLTSIPLGWDGWAGLYIPKEKEGDARQEKPASKVSKPDPFDNDDPF